MSARRWNVVAVVGAVITGAVIGVWVVALYTGGGHTPPPYTPSGVEFVDVCPSAAGHLEDLEEAASHWADLCYPALVVRLDDCHGTPPRGHIQVRGCGDIAPPPFDMDCPDEYFDLYGAHDGAGVGYLDRFTLECSERHLLGHALGLGHTSAATSVMVGANDGNGGLVPTECGTSDDLVDRCD